MRAKDVMSKDVIFVNKEDKLDQVISVLVKNHISGVPVVDKDKYLVGIVTERDLVTKENGINISSYMELMESILMLDGKTADHYESKKLEGLTAANVMSTPVYSVHLETTIEEIVTLMMNRHINRIPVVDQENQLVGIIGRNDLLPILIK